MADALADGLQQCLTLHQEGNLDAAEECYRRLLGHFPEEADLLHLFGLLRAQQGFLGEGMTHLRTAVFIAPEVPLYHFNLASVCLEGGNNEEAIAEFTRCRELSPVYAGVSLGLGRAQAAAGRTDLAANAFQDAAFEQLDDPTPLLLLGELHLRHNFFEQAISAFDQSRQRAGDVPAILVPLARALEGAGDLDRALDAYRSLASIQDNMFVQENIARLDILRSTRSESMTFAADLDSLLNTIRQGGRVCGQDLQNILARTDPVQRVEANCKLARAYLEVPEHSRSEQAGVFARRAWVLSGFADHVLPLHILALTALGDFPGIREAQKRAGIEAAKRSDVGEALRHFTAMYAVDASAQNVGNGEFDFDARDCIARLAEPYRFAPRQSNPAEASNDRIRVVYLLYGPMEPNSLLVAMAKRHAEHRDPDGFEICAFCVDTWAEVMRSADGAVHVRELEEHGCPVHFAPPLSRKEDSLLAIAKAINAMSADLLVISAARTMPEHHFIAALRPTPKILGFIDGPAHQVAPPDLDWSIATIQQAQMVLACGCTLVPAEFDLAEAESASPSCHAGFATPAQRVRRIEAIYRHVQNLPARSTAVLAPPLGSDGVSNLSYWQQIQQEGYFESHPCYQGINAFGEDEKIILKYTSLTSDKTVVEIGCGYGRDVLRIAPLTRHVYGIDVNDAILAKATRFLGERNIDNFTPILAERWEQDIPEGIDVVFSIVVFQHLTKDMVRNYVAGLARKLVPGGCFICQFAEDAHGSSDAMLKKYEPSVRWTADEIAAMVANAGLKLFAVDSAQATESCIWHWAHFGKPGVVLPPPAA